MTYQMFDRKAPFCKLWDPEILYTTVVASLDVGERAGHHQQKPWSIADSVATARAVESQLSGRCALNKLGKIMKILVELE